MLERPREPGHLLPVHYEASRYVNPIIAIIRSDQLLLLDPEVDQPLTNGTEDVCDERSRFVPSTLTR